MPILCTCIMNCIYEQLCEPWCFNNEKSYFKRKPGGPKASEVIGVSTPIFVLPDVNGR